MIFKFPCTIRLIDLTGEFIVFRKFPFMEYSIIIKNKNDFYNVIH